MQNKRCPHLFFLVGARRLWRPCNFLAWLGSREDSTHGNGWVWPGGQPLAGGGPLGGAGQAGLSPVIALVSEVQMAHNIRAFNRNPRALPRTYRRGPEAPCGGGAPVAPAPAAAPRATATSRPRGGWGQGAMPFRRGAPNPGSERRSAKVRRADAAAARKAKDRARKAATRGRARADAPLHYTSEGTALHDRRGQPLTTPEKDKCRAAREAHPAMPAVARSGPPGARRRRPRPRPRRRRPHGGRLPRALAPRAREGPQSRRGVSTF